MTKLKVKLTDPKLTIRAPRRIYGREVVTGARIFEVPDVSFWRRRIKDGSLKLVADETSPPPALKAEPTTELPAEPAPDFEIKDPATEAAKKSKRNRDQG